MTHKCSPCGREFATEAEYLDHECSAAEGAKPSNPEFLKKTTQPNYDAISAAAVRRGEERKTK